MSIIACPGCEKKISSRAVICSCCGLQLGEVTEQDLELFTARKLRDTRYRLNMISYGVITLLVGAFGWYWWESRGFVQPTSSGPFLLMGLAATAYVAVRALLFRNRQLNKALRRKHGLGADARRNL
jgi:hypothetical protein